MDQIIKCLLLKNGDIIISQIMEVKKIQVILVKILTL